VTGKEQKLVKYSCPAKVMQLLRRPNRAPYRKSLQEVGRVSTTFFSNVLGSLSRLAVSLYGQIWATEHATNALRAEKAEEIPSSPELSNTATSAINIRRNGTTPKRDLLHYVTDHPKLAVIMVCLTLAIGFSRRTPGPIGIVICIGTACLLLLAWAHDIAKERKHPFVNSLSWCIPVSAVLIFFGWWLTQPPLASVTFKPSAHFSYYRQFKIRSTLTNFHNYLADMGFDPPSLMPVVGTSHVWPGFPYSQGSLTPETWSIMLPPGNDFEKPLVRGYAGQFFGSLFKESDFTDPSDMTSRMMLAMVYSDYFTSSYDPERFRISSTSASDAVWQIKEKLGKEYVDHAMLIASKDFLASLPRNGRHKDFDQYFADLFLGSSSVLDDNGANQPIIIEAFRQHKTNWVEPSFK
jgi:hypothetical protein